MREDSARQKQWAYAVIVLVFLFALGFSLFINLPAICQGFLSADQAVYFALTQSIARDLDLEYTKRDLIRYYQDFDAGPQGIFLKKASNGRIFFAKSWAYSLFAAPFVRVFGTNGFFVFHSVLLLIVMLLGFAYLSRANPPLTSISYLLSFLFATVAAVYYIWISPDFFNFCLAFIIVFLWLYKIKRREEEPSSSPSKPARSFLLSPGTDYLAAFLVGIAVFSKPPNIVLLAPLVLYALYEKKFFKALSLVVIFVVTVSFLFGINYLLTSDWNYQGGERKTFVGRNFPLEKADLTFDNLGGTMTSEDYFQRFLIPPKFILFNLFYYFFGRFTGITWYFFPAVLALLLFFRARRRLPDWLTLAALAGGILIYIVLTPEFYGGGGGSLANRYFLNIYPLFFFLPSLKKSGRQVIAIWVAAAIFISPILISPFRSSARPATHAKKFPIKALPLEMTQVNHFPTNTNPDAFRVNIWPDKHPPREFLHFLDDNFYPKQEPAGIWTRGDKTCEFILKTYYPLREIGVRLLNNPRSDNEITVKVEGRKQKIILQPKQWGTLRFQVGNGFQVEQRFHYHIKIRAAKGSTPYFEDPASEERRYLGVFFELELVPKE